ncbi:MAG TPA: RNA 2',3'-cyclic phosphodiesterase [Rhodobacteraceae bacterium]|nr:RNA 2',3'-cyclic phosphodiesterase [Paracoccaceae bacterium]
MPRLFTAIEIPERLGERISQLRGRLDGARWVDPENYHLTLRFIGDVDNAVAGEVAEALGHVHRPRFSLHLDGVKCFGGRRPRALFVSVHPNPSLARLAAENERLLQRIGLPAETRRFSPHITLARLKGSTNRAVADFISQRSGIVAESFDVDRFVLFSSRAFSGGGPYIVEAAYPLY